MQGVEILDITHKYACLTNPIWALILCIVAIIICIAGICTIGNDRVQKILISLTIPLTVGIIACLVGASIETDKIIDTKIKVIISEEVSMTEFYEQYDVIEQEGKIFTVREKEQQ